MHISISFLFILILVHQKLAYLLWCIVNYLKYLYIQNKRSGRIGESRGDIYEEKKEVDW